MNPGDPGLNTGAISKLRPPVLQFPTPEIESEQETSDLPEQKDSRPTSLFSKGLNFLLETGKRTEPALDMANKSGLPGLPGLNTSETGKVHSEDIAKAIDFIKIAEKTSKNENPVGDVLYSQLKYSRDMKSSLTQSHNDMQTKLNRLTEKLDQITLTLGQKDIEDPLPTVPIADHTLGFKPVQMGPKFGMVFVYFSVDVEQAQVQARSSPPAKYPEFDGADMNSFSEWALQFMNVVNLYKPLETHACQMAICAMKERAAEMVQPLTYMAPKSFPLLLARMDSIFNPSGHQQVALALFDAMVQKEDMTVQDYAHQLQALFRRAYPAMDSNFTPHLLNKFINGLLSQPLAVKLRSPPVATTYRSLVRDAMAHTAAMYPEHQLCKHKSALYKAAVFRGNMVGKRHEPINTISTFNDDPESIEVIRKGQWKCSLHKTNSHTNSECREQKTQRELRKSHRDTSKRSSIKAKKRRRITEGGERQKRKKVLRKNSRKIHQIKKEHSGSSSGIDKSSGDSDELTVDDESDSGSQPEIEYLDKFILYIDMNQDSELDQDLAELISSDPRPDPEFLEGLQCDESLTDIGEALADAMEIIQDPEIKSEPIRPGPSRDTVVINLDNPEERKELKRHPENSVADTTNSTVRNLLETKLPLSSLVPKLPAYVNSATQEEFLKFAHSILRSTKTFSVHRVLNNPSGFYDQYYKDQDFLNNRMDQALSIVLAGNYSATRSRIVRFPAYANEVKTLLNRALNLCAETIYDA